MTTSRNTAVSDVLIIGYGPVGQTLAILLAQHGHQVTVIDKWNEPYPLPRAVTFDGEAARIFAAAGIADQFPYFSEPNPEYEWRNRGGETLLRFEFQRVGRDGWPETSMFTQPKLEEVLGRRAESFPNVTVIRGAEAVDLAEIDGLVEVVVTGKTEKQRKYRASYVIGCDGANSFVRQRMHAAIEDLGFFYDWLVVDIVTNEDRSWSPVNLQVCDPRRPTTVVSGGPGRRRWEFMRMPNEDRDQLNSDEVAWRLLADWDINPQNSRLEKRAMYTFQARWVDQWRDGRLFIAGDAAHLMPPFMGQGMCSGIRDAANLAWKLDFVLRGVAPESLLSTYGTERGAHVRHAIHMSVELGKVICASDPEAVAERDAALIAAGARPELALPPPPPAILGPGVVETDDGEQPKGVAGQVSAQTRVRTSDGRTGLLDELAGVRFHLLVDGSEILTEQLGLTERMVALLEDIGARIIRVVPPGTPLNGELPSSLTVEDLDGTLLLHMRASGDVIQLVRPDFYVFGGVADLSDLSDLLTKLEDRLGRFALSGAGAA